MKDAKRTIPLAATDILTVLVASAAVFFVLAFGGKVVEAYRLERHNTGLEAEKAGLEIKRQALVTELAYVQSPEYVEKVAREQWKWTKPGDKLVIMTYRYGTAAPGGATSGTGTGEAAGTSSGRSMPDWVRRLRSLFD
jgi:cell division protein FtsB